MPFDLISEPSFSPDPVLRCLRLARDMVARPGGWKQGPSDWAENRLCPRAANFQAMIDMANESHEKRTLYGYECLNDLADAYLYAVIPTWFIEDQKRCTRERGSLYEPWHPMAVVERFNDQPDQTQAKIIDWIETAIWHCENCTFDPTVGVYLKAMR
jgi:hypothetical protein